MINYLNFPAVINYNWKLEAKINPFTLSCFLLKYFIHEMKAFQFWKLSVRTSQILTFSGWGTLPSPSFSPSFPPPPQKTPSNLGPAHVSSLLTPLVYFL